MEETVTLGDFLRKQEELEKEAAKIMPGDHDTCSYNYDYAKQAVYACLTCTPIGSEPAGFCYSCSIMCHTDHDVKELFDKRSFRCDCGNSKFKGQKCQLCPQKDPVNSENKYNQNFFNKFCYCSADYQPEIEEEDMIKCYCCEDWFHTSCITEMPDPSTWKDFICLNCVTQFPFLKKYISTNLVIGNPDAMERKKKPETTSTGNPDSDSSTSEPPPKKLKLMDPETKVNEQGGCQIENVKEDTRPMELFCKDTWREKLCKCDRCYNLFDDSGLKFLINGEEEMIPLPQPSFVVEEEGEGEGEGEGQREGQGEKQREGEVTSLHEAGIRALSGISHQKAAAIALATKQLGDSLKEYLTPFLSENKVVTKEDIQNFFQEFEKKGFRKPH